MNLNQTKYLHLRYAPTEDEMDDVPFSNFGGATIAYKFKNNGVHTNIELGLSVCSFNDNYSRALGRTVSTYRLQNKAPHWFLHKELPNNEVVKMQYEDILKIATEHWPKELDAWNTSPDSEFPEPTPASEETMS